MIRIQIVLILALASPCLGQASAKSTGDAQTTGTCSPAVSGNNNKFTITCQNIPEKLRNQIVDLLNRISKDQSDAFAVSKVDSCLVGVKELQEQGRPWQLTDNQKNLLNGDLASASIGDATVSVHVIPTDRNASLMGVDILNVLVPRKWSDKNLTSDFTLNPQLVGVHVLVKNTRRSMSLETWSSQPTPRAVLVSSILPGSCLRRRTLWTPFRRRSMILEFSHMEYRRAST
jgi:hypothetical protein